ncbi:MAG: transposase [Silicimonas sp.]|nr:transposase [Silicimonas sp.]
MRAQGWCVPDDGLYLRSRHRRLQRPGGRELRPYWRHISKGRPAFGKDGFKKYYARKQDCAACPLKPRYTPNQATRKIARSRHENARQKARDIATTDAYVASSHARKKVEMLFAHFKRIIGLDRLRLRGPNGAKDEFHLAATVQNLRKLAKLRPISV